MKFSYITFLSFAGILCGVLCGFVLSKEQLPSARFVLEQKEILKNILHQDQKQEEKKETKILFVGDIMLSRAVQGRIERYGNFSFPFLLSSSTLASYDITVGNLEGPISDKGKDQGSIYSFRADPRVIEGIIVSGFDVLSLANNHMFDWGRLALSDTVLRLHEVNIMTIGAGRTYDEANTPAIVEKNGERFAFLSYTDLYPKSLYATGTIAGISEYDLEHIKQKISDLKKSGHIVFVMMHWGEEYQTHSNTSQKAVGRAFISAGADAIIGGHPHVAQEIEQYERGWIVYSLGNFVFDQNFSKETMEGLTIECIVRDGKIVDIISRPIKINKDFQPEFSEL